MIKLTGYAHKLDRIKQILENAIKRDGSCAVYHLKDILNGSGLSEFIKYLPEINDYYGWDRSDLNDISFTEELLLSNPARLVLNIPDPHELNGSNKMTNDIYTVEVWFASHPTSPWRTINDVTKYYVDGDELVCIKDDTKKTVVIELRNVAMYIVTKESR